MPARSPRQIPKTEGPIDSPPGQNNDIRLEVQNSAHRATPGQWIEGIDQVFDSRLFMPGKGRIPIALTRKKPGRILADKGNCQMIGLPAQSPVQHGRVLGDAPSKRQNRADQSYSFGIVYLIHCQLSLVLPTTNGHFLSDHFIFNGQRNVVCIGVVSSGSIIVNFKLLEYGSAHGLQGR